MSDRPQVWAHRGASGYVPENTLVAFEMAKEQGAQGVELDIQLSKDGEIVVIHDEWLDRTSNGTGWVKDYTLEELREFNYNKTHPEVEYVTIPTMREVFELLKDTDMMINIELKTSIVFYEEIEEKILALTKEMEMEDRVIYSSFNHSTILRIQKLKPDAKVGFLYADGTLEMPAYGEKYQVDALHPALYNLQYPHFMEECKEKGLAVHTWTVNEQEHMVLCIKLGVDAMITNYPDVALQVVEHCC